MVLPYDIPNVSEEDSDSVCCTRRILIAEDNEFNLETVI
jgi:two-component system, sensor histidine kinase and response regulator